ncbi:MAG: hypothetical protein US18_C0008G0001 [Parcubacteria group bacterium GW2011_GWB1_36_5]|nr:MAG: hypothetical protein US18_C0008G0001 [Parcubacteria group bacterium GW2011_GWB1_36_5]
MKINNEKINTNPAIPEGVLNMYKIDGQEYVSYEHYLKSKKLFESKIDHSEGLEKKFERIFLWTIY